ncbi:hypothetical protein OG453_42240 [Streptomyces sp. NBC_01381]|uniref:hypothetical protein n=1 Tax=Streptomyces sp. NBC_01381 TaxID=2903845 RepID=UPI00224DD74F|nr:hypothetical protein [Streptomyces sp. NBC_01381]MCX4673182.1 hypothetical protein [Streptomyces sp. NBC_01381]
MTATPTGRDSAPRTGRRRLTYFHGQLLSAQDLRQEQGQFLARLRLHNLALHGYGVAYGLWTRPVPPPAGECPDPDRAEPWIEVSDGVAVDRHGDELTVPCGVLPRHNLWRMLDEDDRGHALDELRSGRDVIAYLTIHHCEEPVDSVRAVYTEACDGLPRTAYARIREGFALRATIRPPRVDPCDPPCPCEPSAHNTADTHGCGDGRVIGPGLLLARVDGLRPDRALAPEQIHPEVRRPLARRPTTVITGISWQHGDRLTTQEARTLLGEHGLQIHFSRPVRTATLWDPGIADLFQVTGGRGVHGTVMRLETELVTQKPDAETAERITIRQTDHEYLNDGDRIHLVLRTPFVLDICGDPVDGTHTGGLVPQPGRPIAHRSGLLPPDGSGPRTSGTPAGASGVFESWIFIDNHLHGQSPKREAVAQAGAEAEAVAEAEPVERTDTTAEDGETVGSETPEGRP